MDSLNAKQTWGFGKPFTKADNHEMATGKPREGVTVIKTWEVGTSKPGEVKPLGQLEPLKLKRILGGRKSVP